MFLLGLGLVPLEGGEGPSRTCPEVKLLCSELNSNTVLQVKNKYLKESSKNSARMTRAMAGESKDVAGLRHMSQFLMSEAEPSGSEVAAEASASVAAAAAAAPREAAGETSPRRAAEGASSRAGGQGGAVEWEEDEGVACDNSLARFLY